MASSPATTIRFIDSIRQWRVTGLAFLTLFLLGTTVAPAAAETLMMPSRDMLMGAPQVVWGVTTLPNHTAGSPTTYSISFGDGSANAAGNVTDRSYIAVNHTYAVAGTFTATLQVTNAGAVETATVVIRVFEGGVISAEQLRGVRINSAIEDGLRYLWVNQAARTTNFPNGVTTNWGSSYPESFAALIVLAFENHNYLLPQGDAAPTGLYEKYIVRRGLNFVIDALRQFTLTAQAAGDPCVNVNDGPAPCVGLRQNQQQEGYATALAILPLAASNTLNRHVAEITGSQNGGFVVGKTYAEVLQRLVNAMAWGQGESGFARGGWAYSFNAGNTDGSTIGWNVLALLDAAAAGSTVPAFVKSEFVNFAIPFGLNNDGTFDYTSGNNPAVPQGTAGANMAKNGIGVQAMFYADLIGLGNAQVLAGRNAISNRWNAPVAGDNYPCGNNLHNKGCGYAMFNVFKALKLQGVTTLPGVSRPAGPGAIPAGDWYADYVDWLIANQTAPTTLTGGHWAGLSFSCCGEGVVGSAALAELILSPVALIAPDPTLFSTIGLGPTTALLAPGGNHTVTATATSSGGAPVAGATVSFNVLTGPNAGATGQGVTNAAGQTTFTYADSGGPGRDTIRAFIGTLGSNTVEALWQVPTCTGASAVLQSPMYPLDQGWRGVSIAGVTGATVTQVCQDEPPNFENIAAWAVDADGVGTSALRVRAQRSGTRTAPGNGRVYHIYYTASSCSGQVTVGVPTAANGTAGDDGALYNSVTGASCAVPSIPTITAAPSFIGKTPAVAAAEAAAAGVQLTIASLNSPNVPAGVILSQFPGPGTNVALGSAIVITVSSGPTSVAVPNVVGTPQNAATTQIAGVGLAPSITEANDPVIAAGLVISQAPVAGTQVPPGSGVSLTVSLGAAVATVPNVVARNLAGAVNSIIGAALNLGTVGSVYDATVAEGLVISQNPAGGTTVGLGSVVNIVFSLGPQPTPVPVPTVVGLTEAQALANIAAASLVAGNISRVSDPTVPAGYVIAQVPANTSTALPGSSVDLTVSIGPAGSNTPPESNPLPTLTIETPTSGSTLDTDVQVIGSVQDDDLRGWTLEYSVPGTFTWNRIGSGATPVASGLLGTFPATLVANGPYRIRLTASDNNHAVSREVEVLVDSNDLKLGDFTLAYEDLRIPGLTFPISVRRTYDTKRLYAGDFGPGWFLSFTGVDLRRAANNDIFITLPTGRRVHFLQKPVRNWLFPIYTNVYVGAPGVADTLENTDCPYLFGGNGIFLCGFLPYEPQDFVLKTTEGLTYTIHASGGISRIEDRGGNFVDITPGAITTSWGVTVPITRNAQNRITRIGEPSGPNGIAYAYDAAGRLVEVRDQADQATTFFYEDARFPNYLTRVVDPLGRPSVRTVFNDQGRLIAECSANGDPATLNGCVRFDPDVTARVQTIVNARGFVTEFALDDRGNVTSERRHVDGGAALVTTRTYDTSNNLLTETDPAGGRKSFTYDNRNNKLTETGPDGRTTTYTYNSCDKMVTGKDPAGHTTTYAYDAACNLTSVTDALGGVIRYEYNTSAQRTAFVDAMGSRWTWTYDAQGQLIGRTDPFGKTTLTTFSLDGDLLSRTDRNGRRIDFEYDGKHRLVREAWADGRVLHYDYDANDDLVSAVDLDSVLAITYTSLGQMATVDNQGTPGAPRVALTYEYDGNGNVVGVTDSLGGHTNYGYDVLDRPSRVTQSGAGVAEKRVDVTYNASGLPLEVRRYATLAGTNGVVNTSYEYECEWCQSRLSAIRHHKASDGSVINDLRFSRDAAGNLLRMIDADGQHDYSHDSIGRLLSATHPGAGPQPNESYVYDAAGNRLSSHLSVAYDYSNLTSGAGNRLMQDAQFAYAYDNEGNLVEQIERSTGALTTYTYDFRNRLTSIVRTTAGGLQTDRSTFVYDALNRRIRSTENGQTSFYTYDVVNPVLKLTGAATVRRLYGRGADRVLADESAGAVRWFLTDQVGTVRDLVSNDATVLEHYVLDSFGRVVAQANHADNDLLVSGREHSAAHGLEYFRARFYDARNGRFLSEDPLYPGQYTYVGNRPLTATDPLGLMIIEEAELDNVAITFGHGARHLLGTSLTQAEVEAAIEALIREILANGGTVGGSFWLRLEVQGIPIIARAYVVAAAWISVGTYYPI